MADELIEKSREWTVRGLCEDVLHYQDPDAIVHLVVSDGATGQMMGCSEFEVHRCGRNIVLSGITANSPKGD